MIGIPFCVNLNVEKLAENVDFVKDPTVDIKVIKSKGIYCFDEQEKDGNNYFGCVLYNDNCHSIIQITRKKTMIG